MRYVSLHHHTTYSYMDGYGLPEDHVKRAADLGMGALALTEHGNVSSHVKLEIAAKEHGIKPIFGLEAYTGPTNMRETGNQRKWHLTILAMNEIGYRNLMQLVTRSWDEGFYRWPTITSPMLQDHHEGLIVLSGCADSKLACDLLGGKGRETGDIRDAERTLLAFKRLLGDRFYLEVQQFPELQRTQAINSAYEELGHRFGIPLAASSDCHYPLPEHNEMQKILHAAGRNIGTVEAAEAQWEYDIHLTLPGSDARLLRRLRSTGLRRVSASEAIANTAEIAERCNVSLPKMDRVRYPIEEEPQYELGMTTERMFRMWLNDGWRYRGFHRMSRRLQKEYKERADYEFGLMKEKGFLDYFMMLSDAVRACKDNGIPVGPARGSAAASLVCYLLRITEIDPMKYPLMLFERFIAPDRHDLPDVDLDFDDDLRDFVRQHMARKYGEDRVGNIGTFTKYRGKNSIDDVARVYRVPQYEVEAVKNFIPERTSADERFDASISDMLAMYPNIKQVFDAIPSLYNSIKLEGNLKGMGVHAAGVVVGADKLWHYVATYSRNIGDRKLQVLSVDKYDGEYLGLLKLDALGLKTMGMIRIALGMIGMKLEDLYSIPTDDPKVMDAFRRADVTGIFQFEGRTMRLVTQELRPTEFMDLAAINALARPGPYNSGTTGEYIAARHGRLKHEPLHPIVERICEATEGQIIYQEQILRICSDVGDFPWTHSTTIRKIISQKYGEAAFEKFWQEFRKGAAKHGIEEQLARKIWNRMLTAGLYAFNVAHSISYALIGYWSMWLKVHHPLAFYAAQLQKTDEDDKSIDLMRDMMDYRFERSYEVKPPHPEESGVTWTPVENGVRAGFSQIPGIGLKTAEKISEFSREVPLRDWGDLAAIKGIGPKTVTRIKEFVSKEDPFDIHKIEREIAAIRKWLEKQNLPMPDTLSTDIPFEAVRSRHVVLGLIRDRQPQDMYENYRARTGEELDPKNVKDPHLSAYMTLFLEDVAGRITLKLNRWTYPKFKKIVDSANVNGDYLLAVAVKKPYHGRAVHAKQVWIIDPD